MGNPAQLYGILPCLPAVTIYPQGGRIGHSPSSLPTQLPTLHSPRANNPKMNTSGPPHPLSQATPGAPGSLSQGGRLFPAAVLRYQWGRTTSNGVRDNPLLGLRAPPDKMVLAVFSLLLLRHVRQGRMLISNPITKTSADSGATLLAGQPIPSLERRTATSSQIPSPDHSTRPIGAAGTRPKLFFKVPGMDYWWTHTLAGRPFTADAIAALSYWGN